MADNLLIRKVKSSKRGLFIYFGGWRYHPQKKTHAALGAEVKLESPFRLEGPFAVVHVNGHKEVWRQVGEPNNPAPFFKKRIKATGYYGWVNWAESSLVSLVRR